MTAPIAAATPPSARKVELRADELVEYCRNVSNHHGRLVSLWASQGRSGFILNLALQDTHGLQIVEIALDATRPEFPDLSAIFPVADRLQRAARDLVGVSAVGGDARPWLRHAAWPADAYPLRHDASAEHELARDTYAFVRVAGDGVHEIPVGPVHAGIIEPGHFRFSVVGEKVLRLEERLGYVHKGIEKRFEALSIEEGARLAARVSGDSAVAFSWAYCSAAEQLVGASPPPPRACWLRALALERERLANHLGDLGALGNDAGFAFGLAQFSRLKEQLLRSNSRAFGQRYLFDAIVPGGVSFDLRADSIPALLAETVQLAADVKALREIYDNHAGVQDRFVGAGQLSPDLAARLGVIGLAGRASGQLWDLRCDAPIAPYDALDVRRTLRPQGDVAARVAVRFDEIAESARLCTLLLDGLPAGDVRHTMEVPPADARGYGWVEGWRGPVFVALTAAAGGGIARCHPQDPSWHIWPAIEHAVIGNIVPDFPLINKSFNLSYSGHDL